MSNELVLLSDRYPDSGYADQRIELAGRTEDRALLEKYPLLVVEAWDELDTKRGARALLWYDAKAPLGQAWCPTLRSKIGDDMNVHVLPVGVLIERYGLRTAKRWLPLLGALLAERTGWITLDSEAGHVELGADRQVLGASLSRDLRPEEVDIGLHALRLGGAKSVPVDSPFYTLASTEGLIAHVQVAQEDDPAARHLLVPLTPRGFTANARPQAMPYEMEGAKQALSYSEAGREYLVESKWESKVGWDHPARGLSKKMWPLWDHLVTHRFGFDLVGGLERSAIRGDVNLRVGNAILVGRWIRLDAGDESLQALRKETHTTLPWHFHLAHYVHEYKLDEPNFALREERKDKALIRAVLAQGARQLGILSFFDGEYVY